MLRLRAYCYISVDGTSIREKFNAPEKYGTCWSQVSEIRGQFIFIMKKKNTDYLKYYSEYFDIEWDRKKYQVHHIDGNRKNNDIENLILLPTKLHREIHTALIHLWAPDKSAKEAVQEFMTTTLNGWSDWFIGTGLRSLYDAIYDCQYWAILKNSGYHHCDGEKIKRID